MNYFIFYELIIIKFNLILHVILFVTVLQQILVAFKSHC